MISWHRFRLLPGPSLVAVVALTVAAALPSPLLRAGADLRSVPDGLVVLTFDDASRSHLAVAAPALRRYGFGATFFISEGFTFSTNKTDYLTWEEIRALHDAGFEIGNHTRDHMGVTPETVARLDRQLEAIEARCRQHGIPAPSTFAWPANAITTEALPVLRRHGIRFARRGGAPEYRYEHGRGRAYEPGFDHPLLIPTAGDARPEWTLDEFAAAVDLARDGKIAVLQFHGVPDGEHPWVNTPRAKFETYMNYLHEHGCTVIALGDLARYVDPDEVPSDPWRPIHIRAGFAGRARARDLGIEVGALATGPHNAITDVSGVRVGHETIWEGDSIRTGVTAVLPHGGNIFRDPVPAAFVSMNGFGKPTGTVQIRELGQIETPILLGSTLSVPRLADALLDHVLGLAGNEDVLSVNPVVGETNDGYLSDGRARPVTPEHVARALRGATGGAVAEGTVGAGTGTRCLGYKGGIGTSSRRVVASSRTWTVGVLVQTNFGGELSILGHRFPTSVRPAVPEANSGSCVIVVATGAPLDSRQLARLARRSFAGMARSLLFPRQRRLRIRLLDPERRFFRGAGSAA